MARSRVLRSRLLQLFPSAGYQSQWLVDRYLNFKVTDNSIEGCAMAVDDIAAINRRSRC